MTASLIDNGVGSGSSPGNVTATSSRIDLPTSTPVELLDKRGSRIQRMFGQIAPWYDFLNHLLSLNIDRRWRDRVVKLVPPGPATEGPILDLCTGTGDLALTYAKASRGQVPIVGADFCPEMLAVARRKNRLARVSFLEADAQNLPFADNSFQIVTNAFGLRNVSDTMKGLTEMVRVTRPQGRVAILEFSKPRHWLLGRLYRGYFRYLLPLIGQCLSRSPESAYRYLPESAIRFPDYEDLADLMRQAGLVRVQFFPFTFGIATLYLGVKPASARTDAQSHPHIPRVTISDSSITRG